MANKAPTLAKTSPVSNGGKVSEQGKSKPGSSQSVTPPPSGKFPRTKPTTDKQRVEEDIVAKERLKLLRTTPNEFGLVYDDYSDLMTCPLNELSNTCGRIFKYDSSANNYKSVMLDHLYVRAVYEFREFAQDEETVQKLVNLFVILLEKLKESRLGPDVVDMIGETYRGLLYPKQLLAKEQIEKIMDFYKETLLYQHRLIRCALTTETQPLFITSRFQIELPTEKLSSNTTPLPLAEAIPKKTKAALATFRLQSSQPAAMPPQDAQHGEPEYSKALRDENKGPQEMAVEPVVDTENSGHLKEEEMLLAVQHIVTAKLRAFQLEVETAVRIREKLFNEKTNNKFVSKS